ncbi:menin-like [Acanthaster planci]|uniref:Menin n=1 Tax=Acanthaster planci TaxID=133434 RepID=A0A8B7ZUU3_ACAPL|nr:menin-like [Acanthaster planci]
MAGIRDSAKRCFPLQDIKSVVSLFRTELTETTEPSLAMLSIVAGIIENVFTSNRGGSSSSDSSEPTGRATVNSSGSPATAAVGIEPIFPVVELPNVEALYCKFEAQIKGSVDLSDYKPGYATRGLIKKVSDIIWSSLTRSYYKEKAHLQSLFSYLTGNKLDCFGVAVAVVAACQILGYEDVHLALSEDHAWVVFGEDGTDTAEVTWHGKGNEDKRGQSIKLGVAEGSWLYLNDHPVVCDRRMEVAALVSAINPSINSSLDSIELASLQQDLMWLLYDLGHLKKYPMALGNLGDLESIDPTPGRPSTIELFQEAIAVGQNEYDNHHVYPYTYLGGHLYRKYEYKRAMEQWAEAAGVISRYNYNREDEEVYKEFMEIANDLIPYILKTGSAGDSESPMKVINDPACYGYFLRFYDGICLWEEGSTTPVLHITWAKRFIASLTRFSADIRELVEVESGRSGRLSSEVEAQGENGNQEESKQVKTDDIKEEETETKEEATGKEAGDKKKEDFNQNIVSRGKRQQKAGQPSDSQGRTDTKGIDSASAAAPFVDASCSDTMLSSETDFNDFLSTRSNGSAFPGMTMESVMKAESPAEMAFSRRWKSQMSEEEEEEEEGKDVREDPDGLHSDSEDCPDLPVCRPPMAHILLYSAKMLALKEILTTSGKLNMAAIQLQLTAQSQVHVSKRPRSISEYEDYGSLRRRPRRE